MRAKIFQIREINKIISYNLALDGPHKVMFYMIYFGKEKNGPTGKI